MFRPPWLWGTDLFQVVITGSVGTLFYALDARVDLLMALIMLATASAGAQLGVAATRYVDGSRIKFLYGITVLSGSISVALEQGFGQRRWTRVLVRLGHDCAARCIWNYVCYHN